MSKKVRIRDTIPVCDFGREPWKYFSLSPGNYQVLLRQNPGGLGVEWYVLVDRPTVGAAIPVWEGNLRMKPERKEG